MGRYLVLIAKTTSAESTPVDLRLGFFFLCTAVSPVVGEPGVSLSPGGILVVTFECQTLGGTNRNEDRRNIEFNIEKTRNAKAPLHNCPGSQVQLLSRDAGVYEFYEFYGQCSMCLGCVSPNTERTYVHYVHRWESTFISPRSACECWRTHL